MTDRPMIPERGTGKDQLLAELAAMKANDADWRHGRTFSLVYNVSEEHEDLVKRAYGLYLAENGLSPIAFPSLRKMETEVVAMTAAMLHGDESVVGSMTSGGTESILMAMKAYREWARATKPQIANPEVILPVSAHPAFEKAAHYLGLTNVHIPVGDDFRADVAAARDAITLNTILIVGSAPGYPAGVIDPIGDLAALAAERGLGMHVDACLGGFCLPWVRQLGYPVADFDFAVPGVTSISADVHKYGYAAKGASTILYRDAELRRHMFYAYTEWPGGLYGTPTMTGARPGGAIAAAWAAMRGLGREGYLALAKRIMDARERIFEGFATIPGIEILGTPAMGVFAFRHAGGGEFAIAEAMDERGWKLDRQQNPTALHMMLSPAHLDFVDEFLADLRACVALVEAEPARVTDGAAAMYGAMATMPDRGVVGDFVLDFLDGVWR
ncbi:MAG: aspartate aminotransferase family protein [Deltaproteobacteria bacterium]|nr:aspartate aminotransferase family protein [Deltaproteobacteria bacterium]